MADGEGLIENRAMKGASSGAASFISHAGSMSREHCFAGDEVMTLMTSSVVIGRNSHMPGVWQVVKVASLAQDVDARISAILFSMTSRQIDRLTQAH